MWNPPDPYEPTSEPYRLMPPRRQRSELREALDAATGLSTRQENVISWLRELGAPSASSE